MKQGRSDHQSAQPNSSTFELETSIPGVTVKPLAAADSDLYYSLLQRNIGHLTAHGDYGDEVTASSLDIAAELSGNDPMLRCGVFVDHRLVGRVDLIPYEPGCWGLGYWLGNSSTGRGLATAGCGALIEYARSQLGATDIYAGVTKGNAASEKVLARLGFIADADLGTYTLFHLGVAQAGPVAGGRTS